MARGAFSRAGVGDADVEDAVQETLLAIHLKRHTWDPGQPLTPWVYAIARTRSSTRSPSRPAEGRTAREFRGVPGRAGGRGSPCAERCAEAPGDACAAPARHRDLDLPRRPIDRCDGEPALDVRDRRQGGASSGAQVAWRGLAEVDRVRPPNSSPRWPRSPSSRSGLAGERGGARHRLFRQPGDRGFLMLGLIQTSPQPA